MKIQLFISNEKKNHGNPTEEIFLFFSKSYLENEFNFCRKKSRDFNINFLFIKLDYLMYSENSIKENFIGSTTSLESRLNSSPHSNIHYTKQSFLIRQFDVELVEHS